MSDPYYAVYPKDMWKQPAYRLMDKFSLKDKKGMVTGGSGGIGRNTAAAYGTSKAGVSQYARYLAAALAKDNIRVNTISPGYIWSGIHEGVMNEAAHDLLLEVVPMGRFGKTEELQGVMLFLASDASAYVTGVNIPIDGGYSVY